MCHQHAFEYFGGLLPAEVMVDNCKTAVANVRIHGETKRSPLELFAEGKGGLRPR